MHCIVEWTLAMEYRIAIYVRPDFMHLERFQGLGSCDILEHLNILEYFNLLNED